MIGALALLAVGHAAGAGAGPVAEAGLGGGAVLLTVADPFAGRGVAIQIIRGGVDILGVGVGPFDESQLRLAAVSGGGVVGGFRRSVAAGVGLVALQQGVAFQFGLDEGLKLQVRQLQQLDRLLQLGRDDQPLPLSDLQPLTDHVVSTPHAGAVGPLLAGIMAQSR